MKEQTRKDIEAVVEDVMGLGIAKYTPDRAINTITEWDSFNNLMLISRLEDMLRVQFTAQELEATTTIGGFWQLLQKKVVE